MFEVDLVVGRPSLRSVGGLSIDGHKGLPCLSMSVLSNDCAFMPLRSLVASTAPCATPGHV